MSILIDPTGETASVNRQRPARPPSLNGLSVGILDISKSRGNIFLDRLDHRFTEAGVSVKRYSKPTFARPAPTELSQQIATEVDLVVEGLADWGSCTSCCTHDIVELESRGIPSVGVATNQFIEAAQAQAKSLAHDASMIFVPHPVQDRTDDELREIADAAFENIVKQLIAEWQRWANIIGSLNTSLQWRSLFNFYFDAR